MTKVGNPFLFFPQIKSNGKHVPDFYCDTPKPYKKQTNALS